MRHRVVARALQALALPGVGPSMVGLSSSAIRGFLELKRRESVLDGCLEVGNAFFEDGKGVRARERKSSQLRTKELWSSQGDGMRRNEPRPHDRYWLTRDDSLMK